MKYADAWEELRDSLQDELEFTKLALADADYKSTLWFTRKSKLLTLLYLSAYLDYLEEEHE